MSLFFFHQRGNSLKMDCDKQLEMMEKTIETKRMLSAYKVHDPYTPIPNMQMQDDKKMKLFDPNAVRVL